MYEIDLKILKEVLDEKEWREAIIITDEWALQRIIQIVAEWWQDKKNNRKLGRDAFPRKLNTTVREVLYHAPRKARDRYKDLARAYFQAELTKKRALEKTASKAEERQRQPVFDFG